MSEEQQIVTRQVTQKVEMPDGSTQEISVQVRRTKRADDRMQMRLRKEGKPIPPAIDSKAIPNEPKRTIGKRPTTEPTSAD